MIRLIRLWAQPCFTPRQLPWLNGSYDLPWSGIFWYWVFVVNGENEEWKIASASGLWAELLLIEYATNLQHNNTKHITGANLARNAKPNCDASLNAAACYTASVSVFLSRKVLKKFNETGACRKSEFVKTRPYLKKNGVHTMRRRRPVLWYQVVPNQMSKRRHRSVSLTGKTPPSSPHLSSLHLRSFLGSRPDAPRPSANPFFSGPQHAGHALFTCCVSRPRRAMPQNANVRSFTRQPHHEDSTTA